MKKLSPKREACTENQKVTHVWDNGSFVALIEPVGFKEVLCPMCGASEGYHVFDAQRDGFCGWSCFNPDCIEKGVVKKSFSIERRPLKNCGVPMSLQDACFANIQQPKSVVEALIRFCGNFLGFLILGGASGTGKSYSSVCCMNKFLDRDNNCLFVNFSDLYLEWLSVKQTNHNELGLIEKYSDCKLLVIDDLGSRVPSDSFLDFIYILINKRSNNPDVGTIISTNLSPEKIVNIFGNAILSRITSGAKISFIGKDRRNCSF